VLLTPDSQEVLLRMRLNGDTTTLRAGNPADREATGALDAGV
jgi:hypothetical protein